MNFFERVLFIPYRYLYIYTIFAKKMNKKENNKKTTTKKRTNEKSTHN